MRLTEYETRVRDEALKTANYDLLADLEETCEGSRSFHYEVHPSGIGDTIYLVFKGEKTLLNDPEAD